MTTHDTKPGLDPDAQVLADQLAVVLPHGLSGLGIAGVREFGRESGAQGPAGPDVDHVEDLQVPGPHGTVPVRLYRPDGGDATPVFLYIHGGGWTFGGLDGGSDHLCRSIVAATGFTVVSVEYRLAPEHKFPVPVDESLAVLSWLRERADEIGVRVDRIAIGGDSAGGNISAAITHLDRGYATPLAAQVLLYPATEYAVERNSWTENAEAPLLTVRDTLWFWDQYLRNADDRTDPRATPSNANSFSDLPPALVIVAGHDPLRDDGLHYAELLQRAGTPVRTLRLDGAFHGFMTLPGLQAYDRGVEAVADFLSGVLTS